MTDVSDGPRFTPTLGIASNDHRPSLWLGSRCVARCLSPFEGRQYLLQTQTPGVLPPDGS